MEIKAEKVNIDNDIMILTSYYNDGVLGSISVELINNLKGE